MSKVSTEEAARKARDYVVKALDAFFGHQGKTSETIAAYAKLKEAKKALEVFTGD